MAMQSKEQKASVEISRRFEPEFKHIQNWLDDDVNLHGLIVFRDILMRRGAYFRSHTEQACVNFLANRQAGFTLNRITFQPENDVCSFHIRKDLCPAIILLHDGMVRVAFDGTDPLLSLATFDAKDTYVRICNETAQWFEYEFNGPDDGTAKSKFRKTFIGAGASVFFGKSDIEHVKAQFRTMIDEVYSVRLTFVDMTWDADDRHLDLKLNYRPFDISTIIQLVIRPDDQDGNIYQILFDFGSLEKRMGIDPNAVAQ